MAVPVFVPTLITTVLAGMGGPLLSIPDPQVPVHHHAQVNDTTFGDLHDVALLGAGVFGALAIAGAIWLHKRVTPELLTPENALSEHENGQPGGAPSS